MDQSFHHSTDEHEQSRTVGRLLSSPTRPLHFSFTLGGVLIILDQIFFLPLDTITSFVISILLFNEGAGQGREFELIENLSNYTNVNTNENLKHDT